MKSKKINKVRKQSKKKVGGKPLDKPLNQYTEIDVAVAVISAFKLDANWDRALNNCFRIHALNGDKLLRLGQADITKLIFDCFIEIQNNEIKKQRIVDYLISMKIINGIPEGYWADYDRLTPEIIISMSPFQIAELATRRAGINPAEKCIETIMSSRLVALHSNYSESWVEDFIREEIMKMEYFKINIQRAILIINAFIRMKLEADSTTDALTSRTELRYKYWVYRTLHRHRYEDGTVVGDGANPVRIPDGWSIAPGDDTDIEVCSNYPWGVHTLIFSHANITPCLICGTALNSNQDLIHKRMYWGEQQAEINSTNEVRLYDVNDLLLRKLDFSHLNPSKDIYSFIILENLSSTQVAYEVAKGELKRFFEVLSNSEINGLSLINYSIPQLRQTLNTILNDQQVLDQMVQAFIFFKLSFKPRIVYKNGDIYMGDVSRDLLKNGYGILVDKYHKLLYKGPWVNDKQQTTVLDKSNTKSFGTTPKFFGEFSEGKKHGNIWCTHFEFRFPNPKTLRYETKVDLLRCTFDKDTLDTKKNVSFPADTKIPDIPFAYVGRFNNDFAPHHSLSPPAILTFQDEIYHTFFNHGRIHGLAYITNRSGRIIRVERWDNGIKVTGELRFNDLSIKLVDEIEYIGFMHGFGNTLVSSNGVYHVYNAVIDYLIRTLPHTQSVSYPSPYSTIINFVNQIFVSELHVLDRIMDPTIDPGYNPQMITGFVEALSQLHTKRLYVDMSNIDTTEKTLFEVACIYSFTRTSGSLSSSGSLSIYKCINHILRNDQIETKTIDSYISLLSNPILIGLIRGLLKCPEIKNLHLQEKIKRGLPHLNYTYIYRCIHLTASSSERYNSLSVGNLVSFSVFQSFTTLLNADIIRAFGPTVSEPVLLIFRLKMHNCSARYIAHFSEHHSENELLTLPNTLYQIKDVKKIAQRTELGPYLSEREVSITTQQYRDMSNIHYSIIITMEEISFAQSTSPIHILRGGFDE